MKNSAFYLPLLLLVGLLAGCRPHRNTPSEKSLYASDIRKAYLIYYGAYYAQEGLPQKVYALDCYSDGLLLNQQGRIEGTGTNLYISDLFVDSSLEGLPAGTYTADTTGAPMTFLPGTDYEDQFGGAYLLRIEEGRLMAYTLLPHGTLTVAYEGDTAVLHFEGTTSQKTAYSADYRGVFSFSDRSKSARLPKAISFQ